MYYTTIDGTAEGEIIASGANPNVNWNNCFEGTPEEIDKRVNKQLTTEEKAEQVRMTRNSYLEMYADSVVSNPLRWADMSEEEQQVYKDYRRYLLDITDNEAFPDVEVLTLEEWKCQ